MRRGITLGAAAAFVLGLSAPAFAQSSDNPVKVTTDSPAGKEYSPPAASAGGGSTGGKSGGSSGGSGSSNSSGSSSGTGSGIGAGVTQSSGSGGSGKSGRQHRHRHRHRAHPARPRTSGTLPSESAIRAKPGSTAAGSQSHGGDDFPWLAVGIAAGVLALGVGGGLWMRRRLTSEPGEASPQA